MEERIKELIEEFKARIEDFELYIILSGDEGLVNVSRGYIKKYFDDYEKEHPLAYKYATTAAEARAEQAKQLFGESVKRDEAQNFRDVMDFAGPRTSCLGGIWRF